MKSFVRPVAFVAAFLIAPSLALAAPSNEFNAAGPRAPATSVHAGLWFTIKNECTGTAYATVADKICLLSIGTATFTTKIRSGDVPAGYSETFNACAAKTGGDGQILFIPSAGISTAAVLVTVKPDSTVAVPQKFCK